MPSRKAYIEVPSINGQFLEQYVIMRRSDGFCLPDPGYGGFTWREPVKPSSNWLPRFYTSPASAMRSLAQWCRGVQSKKYDHRNYKDHMKDGKLTNPMSIEAPRKPRHRDDFDIVAVHMYLGRRFRPTRKAAPRRKEDGH